MPPINYSTVSIRFDRILIAIFYKKMSDVIFHLHSDSPRFSEVIGASSTILKIHPEEFQVGVEELLTDRERMLALLTIAVKRKEAESA